ncbi:MAG TPA: hypothetical protein VLI55_10560 [Bryobacteraceae bacterium]|nr:hypothetical protein [Bryobacteraceae bacterium]
MSKNRNTEQQTQTEELVSAAEFAPRQYSLRTNAITTIKLLAISAGVIGLFWAADLFLAQ